MQGLLIILFIALAVGLTILGAYQSAKRRKELTAWARSKGLRFTPSKDPGMDQRFPGFKCLRQGRNRYAYNIMEGDWSGRPTIAFDYHYETRSSDSKGRSQTHHHHFSAVIVRSQQLLKPLFIRPEHFFDRVTEFFGFDDIDFESAEFSRKFYVKAKDRRWAYDVIHTRTMQFLLDMPQFTIQFDPLHVIAHRSSKFKTSEFEAAVKLILGILDRFPKYLVEQLKGEG
ncbi:MAG: hypothetical protein KAJ01_09180 [Candidatus Hydrogenedentes bacterium]|nr:hypothetical protein [Candidatus Hydrogenedentota bacterium]